MPVRAFALVLAIAAGVFAAGCWRSGSVPKIPPTPAATPVTAGKTPATPAVSPTPPVVAEKPPVEAPAEPDPPPEPPPSEPAALVSKERIILLAPLNPFIIDFQLTIDGQPHDQALERLVDEVIKLADSDGDGRPSWKEVTSGKRFKYGQFGNLAINNDNDHKQIVERYDIDKDTVVDRSELPRFLTRNAGGSRAFSIRGTADYRGSNRRGAPTWRAIDADSDGSITAVEREAAAGLMRIRDTDDDEILVSSDLNPRAALADPNMMTERRRRGPEAARLLGDKADWDNIRLALESDYAGNENLQADSFPLTPQLFAQLDKDGDGRVDRTEIKGLNDVPAHVVIAVDFGKQPAAEEPVASGQAPEESGGGSQEPERGVETCGTCSAAGAAVEARACCCRTVGGRIEHRGTAKPADAVAGRHDADDLHQRYGRQRRL